MSRGLDELFAALARSQFRSRFRLDQQDLKYLGQKGLAEILRHAADLIQQRLVPAEPKNDGRQTPWRGHPVFVAQHATGTCCRSCLAKWHGFPKGIQLTDAQQSHVLKVIERWLAEAASTSHRTAEEPREPGLFC